MDGWRSIGQSTCRNMAKKEGHKTSKDDRCMDGVSVFSLPHKKSKTGFVQCIKLRKFYIDRKGETNCTTGLVIESLFELVPVGCGNPAVWEPTAQLQEILSWDHGHISPLCGVCFKNHDSLDVSL